MPGKSQRELTTPAWTTQQPNMIELRMFSGLFVVIVLFAFCLFIYICFTPHFFSSRTKNEIKYTYMRGKSVSLPWKWMPCLNVHAQRPFQNGCSKTQLPFTIYLRVSWDRRKFQITVNFGESVPGCVKYSLFFSVMVMVLKLFRLSFHISVQYARLLRPK